MTAIYNESTEKEAIMALDLNNQTVSVGKGNTKAMYAVRVHDA